MSESDRHSINTDDEQSLMQVGRSALQVLEIRERAAKYGAARLELQAAITKAESGNQQPLRDWLLHNGTDLGDGSIQNSDTLGNKSVSELLAAVPGTLRRLDSEVKLEPISPDVSPANSKLHFSGQMKSAVSELPLGLAGAKSGSTDFEHKSPIDEDSGASVAALAKTADLKKPDVSKTASATPQPDPLKSILNLNGRSSTTKRKPKFDVSRAIKQDGESADLRKRALKWLSGSIGFSFLVHVMLTIGLGIAVYTISLPPEPLRITSAEYTPAEELDTPIEIPEMEQLEVTEISQELSAPALSTSVDSPATTTMEISESALGPISAPMGNPIGSAVGTAAGVVGGMGDQMNATQFFGVAATGNTFAYVVDNSGSIRADGVFEMAKTELMRSVAALKPTQRFYVCFFGEEVQSMILDGKTPPTYPVYATPENIAKLYKWVAGVKIQGGLPPIDALKEMIALEPDAIFLMFDGDTSVNVLAGVEKINRVTDLISGTRVKVPINTLRFPPSKRSASDEPKFDAMMKELAAQNGGTARYIPKPPKR